MLCLRWFSVLSLATTLSQFFNIFVTTISDSANDQAFVTWRIREDIEDYLRAKSEEKTEDWKREEMNENNFNQNKDYGNWKGSKWKYCQQSGPLELWERCGDEFSAVCRRERTVSIRDAHNCKNIHGITWNFDLQCIQMKWGRQVSRAVHYVGMKGFRRAETPVTLGTPTY